MSEHSAEKDAGCIAMSGGGFRHSFIHDGVCVYCGACVIPPANGDAP